MKWGYTTCLIFASLLAGACSAPKVNVDNAWVRTPPGANGMTAAYFVIENNAGTDIRLVSATSDAWDSVSIHESRLREGAWTMVPLDELLIAAYSATRLQPGGLHLMLRDAVRPVEAGDTVSISLTFADGRLVTVPALVQDSAP